jgi:chromosome segregation ATPase
MPREPVGTGIDTADAEQLLRWLDEERRRDKALLVELEKKVEDHARLFAHSQKTLEGLEDRIDQTAAEVKSLSRFDQAVEHVRDELLSALRGLEERVAKESEDRAARLVEERQARMQSVASLERRIDQALKLEQTLQTQKVDIERVHKDASRLNAQIAGALKEIKAQQERVLVFGERLRKGEESAAKATSAAEEVKSRFDAIEESHKRAQIELDRNSQQIAQVASSAEELRERQDSVTEELRRVDDRGKKQISGWSKEMGDWRREAEQLRELLAHADKQLREIDRRMAALDALKIQLEKDRDSLEHLERTAEERQRQQLEEWRKENELLWLTNDERWEQLSQENARRQEHGELLWEAQLEYFRGETTRLQKHIKELQKRLLRSPK